MWATEALERVLRCDDVRTVLDVGSGNGEHARVMRSTGKEVLTVNLESPADIVGDFMVLELCPRELFDCVWCSHVLEHQTNVGEFLKKCLDLLRDDGLLAITVPPAKHEIVGGHLTLWNQGLLVYNLIVAGLDCHHARVSPLYGGYNLSVLVRKHVRPMIEALRNDAGDIETLARYFPFKAYQGFDGNMVSANW